VTTALLVAIIIDFSLIAKYSKSNVVEARLMLTMQIGSEYGCFDDIRIEDLNGDCVPDIIVMNSLIIGISGDGTTLLKIHPQVCTEYGFPKFFWIDDINNDGGPEIITILDNDLVVTYDALGNILWIFNASWIPLNETLCIGCPEIVLTGDVNGDKQKEIVIRAWVINETSKYIEYRAILILNNDGSLYRILLPKRKSESRWTYFQGLLLRCVVDVNNDGIDELIVDCGEVVAMNSDGEILVRFKSPIYVNSFILCDVNNDEFLDFISINFHNYVACSDGKTGKTLWIFEYKSNLYISPIAFVATDIDNDGKLEMIFAGTLEDQTRKNLLFALNIEDGSVLWIADLGGMWSQSGIVTADLNGDNYLDVIVWNTSWIVAFDGRTGYKILLFHVKKTWHTLVAAADVDGDHSVEIVVATWNHVDIYDIPSAGFRAFWWFYSDKVAIDGVVMSNSHFDYDGDGLSDLSEIAIGTNPFAIDTDKDGLSDWYEALSGSNPLSSTFDDDCDLWPNSVDPHPGEFMIPNLWIFQLILVFIVIKIIYSSTS